MGTQFYWVYDVAVLVIIGAAMFIGAKQGIVKMIAGLLSIAVAFASALVLSGFISDKIYEEIVVKKVQEEVQTKMDEVFPATFISAVKSLDADKITVGGVPAADFTAETDSAGKIMVDLSDVDLTPADTSGKLEEIGLSQEEISALKLGKIEVSQAELEKLGLGSIIINHIIADRLQTIPAFKTVIESAELINSVIPSIFYSKAGEIAEGSKNAVAELVATVVTSEEAPGTAILDTLVKPFVLVPIRAILFMVIFSIIAILLSIIVSRLSIINKIPLIGGLNSFLGGIAGLAEGALIVLVVCIFVKLAASITDNAVIFLNEQTVEQTKIFSVVYNLNIIDFE